MAKHGKRYNEAVALVDREKQYTPTEGVALAKKTAKAKFDETVELHLRTGADPKNSDQNVRGVATLPHGVGKPVRVAVFAQGEAATNANAAGAEFVGADDLIKKVEDGFTDFDVSIATPDMMGKVGKLGRVLGRKGLMPNPRTGTVVQPQDLARAVEQAKKGRVEFKLDRTSIIHVPVGKVSFEEQKLVENLTSLMDTIVRARPSGIKGQFIRSAYLTTTMGPGIPLDVASVTELTQE
ncbi:MAG: 50S ribosomal protein L1 [SAR202 cluster bacterium]|nr:50S ribosomal protein L1 [SAR202 cluster bacterium]